MKVGLVCPYSLDVPGGVQSQVRLLAEEIRRRGDEALVVGSGVEAAAEGEIRLGRAVAMPGNGSVARVLIDPRVRHRFLAVLNECDVLHVHEPTMPALGWWAARSGLPQVHTYHADVARSRRWLGRSVRARLPKPSSSTAVSTVAAVNWGTGLSVIPNAVAPLNINTDRVPGRVVLIGRDERRKGIQILLEAWPTVRRQVPDAELHLTIDGPSEPGVIKHGTITEEEKWGLLSSAQVAVAPALFGESFGLVVAEALAAGTPLVMSDLKAFKDVAGPAGVTVPAGDSVALGVAVAALLLDSQEQASRSEAGLAAVQRFRVAEVMNQYRSLYDEAIEQAR